MISIMFPVEFERIPEEVKKIDYCIIIGRYQPFHLGHKALLDKALDIANNVIVVIGGKNQERSLKNPWNSVERQDMIYNSLSEKDKLRVTYVHQPDFPGDDLAWANSLRSNINAMISVDKLNCSIALLGHAHDESSFYLKMFPEWEFIETGNFDQYPHATEIRKLYFSGNNEYKQYIPQNVIMFLEKFTFTYYFKLLICAEDLILLQKNEYCE